VADNYRVRPYPNEILAAAKTYFSTENGEKWKVGKYREDLMNSRFYSPF
jgi:hypothetical protein